MKMDAALAIIRNPCDIQFLILDHYNGHYSILVSRGPQGKFAALFSTEDVYDSPRKTAQAVRKILEAVLEVTYNECWDETELFLTRAWVDAIFMELLKKQRAETWKMNVLERDFRLVTH